MSAAAVDAAEAPKKGSKKMIIIIAAAVLLLGGGGGAFMMMKSKAAAAAAAAEAEGEDAGPAHAASPRDPKKVPTFAPLEPFTVNLADRDAERYAQIGITLELDDPKNGELIKSFMPVIRNNILMVLADKTAAQLSERDGKTKLAQQIRRETSRALGYEVEEPEEDSEEADEAPKKKKKKKKAAPALPVTAVHFSNFIIQ
ncbi:MAG: flagellar basal body-associated FliL family protein [Rubrivivax sp.]|nr:flagellar basal body-associated FliL family protein [Rubrivivax sp.]